MLLLESQGFLGWHFSVAIPWHPCFLALFAEEEEKLKIKIYGILSENKMRKEEKQNAMGEELFCGKIKF